MAVRAEEGMSGSRAPGKPDANGRQQRQKLAVYKEVLRRLKESDSGEANRPGFDNQLWAHFNRLPVRYAVDVNVERAEDVLMHKRLLHLAHDPANRPAIEVRLVQIHSISHRNSTGSILSDCKVQNESQGSSKQSRRQSVHPPQAFGLSPNLEALTFKARDLRGQDAGNSMHANMQFSWPMHEITFSTEDKPKLLSQLTALLAEIGLNILEAHAFSTVDGYSLDVFVVEGWPHEETQQLRVALEREVLKGEVMSLTVELPTSKILKCGAEVGADNLIWC